ncbi:MAG TPA: hypothetical protein VFG62_06680 [Rhodopila sp.]|jgi:hypothetical protein|nr:hypothetical protein [Rhodopila sp.]
MTTPGRPETAVGVKLVVFWLLVAIPLLWGVANTIGDAAKLFR